MRLILAALVLGALPAVAAAQDCDGISDDAERLACYDRAAEGSGHCEIEDWRFRSQAPEYTVIDGAATCARGRLSYRLYDGDSDEFLAAGSTYIRGFVFEEFVEIGPTPSSLVIRYSISQ